MRNHSQSRPVFTFVLPVLNEELHLANTLKSIVDQDLDSALLEVYIFDGGSTDRTCRIAMDFCERFPWFHYAPNPGRLPSSARNLGIEKSRGSVLAFVEGHCILPQHYARRALSLLEEHGVHALGRPISLLVESDPIVAQAIGLARESCLGHDRSSPLYSNFEGRCSAVSSATIYRRDVFEALGGFDESLYVAEDVDFNTRFEHAGYLHYFAQDLRCWYHPRRSFASFFRQMVNYGIGRVRFANLRKTLLSPLNLVPLAVVLAFLTSGLASVVARRAEFALPAGFYLMGIVIVAAYSAVTRDRLLLLPLVAFALILTHFGLAVGTLMGFLERLAMKARSRCPDSD